MHLKGESECYECMPRQAPKGFPICTIRNTPDKDIHCIVWAKDLLFERLFGPPEAVTDLDEAPAGDKEAGEAEAGARRFFFMFVYFVSLSLFPQPILLRLLSVRRLSRVCSGRAQRHVLAWCRSARWGQGG